MANVAAARLRGKAASARQLLIVDVVLVLAVAGHGYRPHLPRWIKPEQYGLWPRVAETGALRAQRIRLARRTAATAPHDTLLVGDSVIKTCPWPADRLGHPAYTTEALLEALRRFLPGRTYGCIVLWTGTWEMMRGMPVEAYVEHATAMFTLAQAHANRVVLIAPMPAATPHTASAEQRANVAAVASAVTQLRARLPDGVLVDMTDFRAAAERPGRPDELFLDNLHINSTGYELLAADFLHLDFS